MKQMIKWERGDRVTHKMRGEGTVGLMAEPYATNVLPDGASSWVLCWWVRWDAGQTDRVVSPEYMTVEWGSDLSPLTEGDDEA